MTTASPKTTRHRQSRATTFALLLLILCMLTQCVCQNSRTDPIPTASAKGTDLQAKTTDPTPAPTVTLPARLDVKDLDGDEKALLAAVLLDQFDPCGEPRSFMESLSADETCDRAIESGEMVVLMVQQGLSKRQIVVQLLRELKRATTVADFQMDGSPYMGDPHGKVVVVEFMDFQCPYCKITSKPAKELAKKYGAGLVIKHLPIDHHEFARSAALVSLAADRQGRFWALNALLFEHQDELSEEKILALAKQAGCDMARLAKDAASDEVKATLARDLEEADRFDVDGTPTFYVNGILVDFEQLEAKLQKATE